MVRKKFQRLPGSVYSGWKPSDLNAHIGVGGVLSLYEDSASTSRPGMW